MLIAKGKSHDLPSKAARATPGTASPTVPQMSGGVPSTPYGAFEDIVLKAKAAGPGFVNPERWFLSAKTRIVEGHDGVKLNLSTWKAPKQPATGTVLLFQGRGESAAVWEEMARFLTQVKGVDVVTIDWRGQGASQSLSANLSGHVESFDHFLKDVDHVLKNELIGTLTAPLNLVGYSMGGHLAMRFVREYPQYPFESMPLIDPMVDLPLEGISRGYARTVAAAQVLAGNGEAFAPQQADNLQSNYENGYGDGITDDPRRDWRLRRNLGEHPEAAIGGASNGWLSAAFESVDLIHEPGYIEGIGVPTTFITCGRSTIVSIDAQAEAAGIMPNATQVTLADAMHAAHVGPRPVRKAVIAAIANALKLTDEG